MFCPNCKREIQDGDKFCRFCGCDISAAPGARGRGPADGGEAALRFRRARTLAVTGLALVLLIGISAALWYGLGGRGDDAPPASAESAPPTEDAPAADTPAPTEDAPAADTPAPAETPSAVLGEDERREFLSSLPGVFRYSSGAGGWYTELNIAPDGSFGGRFLDFNAGGWEPEMEVIPPELRAEYVQYYWCDFSGRIGEVERISEYEYALSIDEMNFAQEPGSWRNDTAEKVFYNYREPAGLEGATELRVYLPGRSLEGLSEEFLNMYMMCANIFELGESLEYWSLRSTAGEAAFCGYNGEQPAA